MTPTSSHMKTKILKQNIQLNATKGTETFVKNKDLFTSWFDSDFENYKTDVKGKNTKELKVEVRELTEDSTLKDIFNSISTDTDSLVLSQGQIIDYVKNHKDFLTDWYTFFLFKVSDEFFVAGVRVDGGGRLAVGVNRFSYDDVWGAEFRLRIVVPQLALKNSESSPLDTLTLESAIEKVKEAGYIIYKEI